MLDAIFAKLIRVIDPQVVGGNEHGNCRTLVTWQPLRQRTSYGPHFFIRRVGVRHDLDFSALGVGLRITARDGRCE